MRRLQIYIEESLDDALAAEARQRGRSKASVVRRILAHDLGLLPAASPDPWQALDGWLGDGRVDDIDAATYVRAHEVDR